jgi:predicted nucleotidyltransferase
MQLTDQQRDAIIAWAEKSPEVQAVMLFGSRCKGTARPDSDVDLALSMTKGRRERRVKNYTDNVGAWEADLTAAVGLTVRVKLGYPALGPEMPSYLAACRIDLWRRAPRRGPPSGGKRSSG